MHHLNIEMHLLLLTFDPALISKPILYLRIIKRFNNGMQNLSRIFMRGHLYTPFSNPHILALKAHVRPFTLRRHPAILLIRWGGDSEI